MAAHKPMEKKKDKKRMGMMYGGSRKGMMYGGCLLYTSPSPRDS